jgi:toxin YoeB
VAFFAKTNPKLARKILELIEKTCENPFSGIGKPEPLKHSLSGYWSRRITLEHRMVYRIHQNELIIIQLRFHY